MNILESVDLLMESSKQKFPKLEKKYSKQEVKIAQSMAMKKNPKNIDPDIIEQIIKDLRA